MTQEPTATQIVVVLAALAIPLAWGFTHDGLARIVALMLWLPCGLFVYRAAFFDIPLDAPLILRLRLAGLHAGFDPLTIVWPLLVLLIAGIYELTIAPCRRREAIAAQTRRSAVTYGTNSRYKHCLGCARLIPLSVSTCPHCDYLYSPRAMAAASALSEPRKHPAA